jgi:hypothetical protein
MLGLRNLNLRAAQRCALWGRGVGPMAGPPRTAHGMGGERHHSESCSPGRTRAADLISFCAVVAGRDCVSAWLRTLRTRAAWAGGRMRRAAHS